MLVCGCGSPFSDHEAWMNHVREGIPATPRNPNKVPQKTLETIRATLLEYVKRHRLVENNTLKEKERATA